MCKCASTACGSGFAAAINGRSYAAGDDGHLPRHTSYSVLANTCNTHHRSTCGVRSPAAAPPQHPHPHLPHRLTTAAAPAHALVASVSCLSRRKEPERNEKESRTLSVMLRSAVLSGEVLPPACLRVLIVAPQAVMAVSVHKHTSACCQGLPNEGLSCTQARQMGTWCIEIVGAAENALAARIGRRRWRRQCRWPRGTGRWPRRCASAVAAE